MQIRFEEKVDLQIRKSIKGAVRLFKEKHKAVEAGGIPPRPPSFEEFSDVSRELMTYFKQKDLNRLRSPDMRDLLEKTWSQRLRNFSTTRSLRDAYEALIKKL